MRRKRHDLELTGHLRFRCLSCGTQFKQRFAREVRVVGDWTERELAEQVLEGMGRQLRIGPCPACGRWLPKQGVDRQRWWDQWFAVFVPLLLFAAAVPQLTTDRVYVYWLLAVSMPALAMAALIAYFCIGRGVRIGLPPGNGREVLPLQPNRRPASVLSALAFLLTLVPPLARLVFQTPLNDRCEPLVVQPSHRVRVMVDDSRRSLGGYWGGTAQVSVLNADELGLDGPIKAFTRQEANVDNFVSQSDRVDPPVYAYVDVWLPDRSDLIGKTLELRVVLVIEYPGSVGPGLFRYQTAEFVVERPVTIASKIDVLRDQVLHIGCWAVGIMLFCASSIRLLFVNPARARRFELSPQVVFDELPDGDTVQD